MQTQTEVEVKKEMKRGREKPNLKLTLPVDEYRSIPIPGMEAEGGRLGICYARVIDIPGTLDEFMEINPRVPNRNKKGVLSGPVVKGILETLREKPEEMAVKNQGIYLLANDTSFTKTVGNKGTLQVTFTDPGKHGIVNGGHTYAAIREAIETSQGEEGDSLKKAWVRLHIYQGIDEDLVPEIAEGLNRSKQVDNPSLINLQGEFDIIRKVMKGKAGEKAIAYHQGDEGEVYISEILVYLSLLNPQRFNEKKHPNNLYSKQALGLKNFIEDMEGSKQNLTALIHKLPEFLWLSDSIRKLTPDAAKRNHFKFGRAKMSKTERAGSPSNKGTMLPFLGEKVNYRVPNGWIYPMLSAFRANLKLSADGKEYEWKMPIETILPEVIDDLVSVCVTEHRDNNMRHELIGKRESAYSQCYTRMQLFLAKRNLLH